MSDRVESARQLAIEIHQNQFDKSGYPYLCHVLDVAQRVAHLGEDYEVVGLLHDAVEDAPPAQQDSILKRIHKEFGSEVREGVINITKRKGPTSEDYFTAYLPRLVTNPLSKAVKIADASHNISKAHLIENQGDRDRLRKKYTAVLTYLGEDPVKAYQPIIFANEGNLGRWEKI